MIINKSEWISFLRQYGPIPRNDNMYDEAIHRIIKRKKIEPIIIESVYLAELVENYKSNNPKSVILTGTAGDGKTYNCREVWLELGGQVDVWQNEGKIKELVLSNTKKLYVIKDLSELKDEERGILKLFINSVLNPDDSNVFLIAANDGQLIEAWKNAEIDIETDRVRNCIEEMLVSEIREISGFNLKLYNLSRISSAKLFPQIVDVVLEHRGWNDCNNCVLRADDQTDKKCPIWENRKRLEGDEDDKLIRSRVTDLLELCELNGVHLPIRQLLLLVSNMLLGHPEARDRLMSCSDAMKIVNDNKTSLASIYRNILGENLTERRRESTDVFATLGRFGIGYETSNTIDNILIFGEDDPDLSSYYQQLVLDDTYYGADSTFRANQKDYLEGVVDSGELFLTSLRSQRQRLFFVIPRDKEEELKLWQLTTFQYAGEFLTDVYRVAAKNDRVSTQISSRISQGLNRIFTGLLAKNNNELILATSGSHSQAKVSRIFEESISVPKKRGESMQIKMNDIGKLVIEVSLSPSIPTVELALQLGRYEFLSRVAEGALPGSFSRECYEDILGFKSKLLKQLELRRKSEEDTNDENDLSFRIIRLNQDGLIDDKIVEVNYNE